MNERDLLYSANMVSEACEEAAIDLLDMGYDPDEAAELLSYEFPQLFSRVLF